MTIKTLRARAVIRICDFGSIAMLDYLERTGVFQPELKRRRKRGKPREYTFKDVLILRAIATLLNNGASVSALKNAFDQLYSVPWKAEPAVLEDRLGALRHMVFSGGKVYFSRNNDELIDLAAGRQLSFLFIIDLDELHSEVARNWQQNRLNLVN